MSPVVQKLQAVSELPPKIIVRKTGFERFIEELTNHKGKWYLIATGERGSFCQKLRTNYPDFEFQYRTPETATKPEHRDNEYPNKNIYARWVSSGSQRFIDSDTPKKVRDAQTTQTPAKQP